MNKSLIRFYSLPANFQYVAAAKDATDKQKRIAELKRRFEQSTFANFDSGYVEDSTGVPNADDTFAPEKAEAALSDIKRLVLREEIKGSLTPFLEKRNQQLRQAKANKLAAEKELKINRGWN